MLTSNYFCAYEITKEDREKTQQYKENEQRRQFENKFTNFDDYLRSLEIELTIEMLNEMNIARFVQMTQKTNQFNLTTQRYTETDIRKFAESGALIYGLRVKDRFGDNGLTGLVIVKTGDLRIKNYVEIDTLLLSCRILGKNIEIAFMQYVLMKLKKMGIKIVKAGYIKSLKNNQVENFYEKLNFKIESQSETHKKYILNLEDTDYSLLDVCKVTEK